MKLSIFNPIKKHPFRSLLLFFLILIVTVIALSSYLTKLGMLYWFERQGATVSIDDLELSLWDSNISISGFNSQQNDYPLNFQQLTIDWQWSPLMDNQIILDQFKLEKLEASLGYTDGTLSHIGSIDLTKLVGDANNDNANRGNNYEENTSTKAEQEARPWTLNLNQWAIDIASVCYVNPEQLNQLLANAFPQKPSESADNSAKTLSPQQLCLSTEIQWQGPINATLAATTPDKSPSKNSNSSATEVDSAEANSTELSTSETATTEAASTQSSAQSSSQTETQSQPKTLYQANGKLSLNKVKLKLDQQSLYQHESLILEQLSINQQQISTEALNWTSIRLGPEDLSDETIALPAINTTIETVYAKALSFQLTTQSLALNEWGLSKLIASAAKPEKVVTVAQVKNVDLKNLSYLSDQVAFESFIVSELHGFEKRQLPSDNNSEEKKSDTETEGSEAENSETGDSKTEDSETVSTQTGSSQTENSQAKIAENNLSNKFLTGFNELSVNQFSLFNNKLAIHNITQSGFYSDYKQITPASNNFAVWANELTASAYLGLNSANSNTEKPAAAGEPDTSQSNESAQSQSQSENQSKSQSPKNTQQTSDNIESDDVKPDDKTENNNGLTITIDSVKINDSGELIYTDHTVTPSATMSLNHFSLLLEQFNTDRKPMTLTGQSEINNSGRMSFEGTVTLQPKVPNINLTAKISSLDLVPLSPYSTRYIGYRIDQGQLSADSTVEIKSNNLNSKIVLTFNKFELGSLQKNEKSELNAKLGVPLPAALKLLKDGDNQIKLEIPITGDATAPNFSIKDVVSTVTVKAIKTAIIYQYSPFGLLTLANGLIDLATGLSFDPVEFDAGSYALNDAQMKQLEDIATLTKQKPQVSLVLCAQTSLQDLPENLAVDEELTDNKKKISDKKFKAELNQQQESFLLKLAEQRRKVVLSALKSTYEVNPDQLLTCNIKVSELNTRHSRVTISI